MKKMIAVTTLSLTILLTGCSAGSEISAKADKLDKSITHFSSEMDQLAVKDMLNKNDQQKIVDEIDNVYTVVDDFKDQKVPFFFRKVKKEAVEKLNKKQEKLLKIQKKAEKGNAAIKDVEAARKELADDININLFNK